jgi:hypothetical protein
MIVATCVCPFLSFVFILLTTQQPNSFTSRLTFALIPFYLDSLGKGCYTYPDGRQFDGIYKDNEPDANGTQTSPDGSVLYDGEYSIGEFLGS